MFLQQDNNYYIKNWQYCLQPECQEYQQDKFWNRFLRTDRNSWIYYLASGKTLQSGKD